MNECMQTIYETGIVPVVSLTNKDKAVGLAGALLRGQVPVIEVAFRTPQAAESLRAIRLAYPEMIVGAGTIIHLEQVEQAMDAGAMFIVSPGFDTTLVEYCRNRNIDIVPGVSCASEVQMGVRMGLKVLKFFPAETLGGLKMINFWSAPFSDIRFLPAGGCGFDNLAAYFHNPHVFACAGGFVARASHIESEDWEGVTALCRKAHETALSIRLYNVRAKEGDRLLRTLDFRAEHENLNMENTLIYTTTSVERAVAYLHKAGFSIAEQTAEWIEGILYSVFLSERAGEFRVLLKRAA